MQKTGHHGIHTISTIFKSDSPHIIPFPTDPPLDFPALPMTNGPLNSRVGHALFWDDYDYPKKVI